MTAEPPPDVAGGAEEGEEVLATTQLQVRALGLTGALMQNISDCAGHHGVLLHRHDRRVHRCDLAVRLFPWFPDRARARAVPGPAGPAVPVSRRVLHLREPDARAASGVLDRVGLYALLADHRRADTRLLRLDPAGRAQGQLRDHVPVVGVHARRDPGDRGPRLLRHQALGADDRGARRPGVPDRARARAVGAGQPWTWRVHVPLFRPEFQPRPSGDRLGVHARDRVLRARGSPAGSRRCR